MLIFVVCSHVCCLGTRKIGGGHLTSELGEVGLWTDLICEIAGLLVPLGNHRLLLLGVKSDLTQTRVRYVALFFFSVSRLVPPFLLH